MAKEYVGMAIWFKGAVGPPDMCVAVDRVEWREAAKSKASRFGYSVAIRDVPYPTAQAALIALEEIAAKGGIQGMRRIDA